jgi:hypothetical protein
MTSILAGYIGMRIAVYTNTRVTFTCCTSVHKGFITAFRGGQVLGFCLVGLAILNIMIIILLFKACWYNQYLTEVLDAGRPINRCPDGTFADVTKAQTDLWAFFENQTYDQWKRNFAAAHPNGASASTSVDAKGNTVIDWASLSGCGSTAKEAAVCAAGDTTAIAKSGAVAAKDGLATTATLTSVDTFRSTDFYFAPRLSATTFDSAGKSVDMTAAQCAKAPLSSTIGTGVDAYKVYGNEFAEFTGAGEATTACYDFTKESLCHLWAATADVVSGTGATAVTNKDAANCQTWTYDATTKHWSGVNKTWADAMASYKGSNTLSEHKTATHGKGWEQDVMSDLNAHTTLKRGQFYYNAFPNVPQVGAHW